MALQKDTPSQYGADALYWSINTIFIDCDAGRAEVRIGGYLSLAAFQAGSIPLINRTYSKTGINPDAVTRASIYAYLQTLPEFSGALSV